MLPINFLLCNQEGFINACFPLNIQDNLWLFQLTFDVPRIHFCLLQTSQCLHYSNKIDSLTNWIHIVLFFPIMGQVSFYSRKYLCDERFVKRSIQKLRQGMRLNWLKTYKFKEEFYNKLDNCQNMCHKMKGYYWYTKVPEFEWHEISLTEFSIVLYIL